MRGTKKRCEEKLHDDSITAADEHSPQEGKEVIHAACLQTRSKPTIDRGTRPGGGLRVGNMILLVSRMFLSRALFSN